MNGRLLDVNALIAWEHPGSPHHGSFHRWAKRRGLSDLWTCGHSELGFIRVSMQVFRYSLADATAALGGIRSHCAGFIEVAPAPKLAPWATSAGRTSDAYLVQIATANELKLATFDQDIIDPAVESIPPA